ncbi:flagellar hook-length control protein FliK [Loktanella sp. S4079]|uniref:flagellar hook-length control protein FliK n=1 Tax=Loktanella sp. S4079 TaxID=579483 RepID=UPI0005FA7D12|nr:flagellar hook-length control protein FliK [Loktanella sp. S4079]KJZ21139.1 hypothetical protein TW80_00310 [Loktanella sp. S4079]
MIPLLLPEVMPTVTSVPPESVVVEPNTSAFAQVIAEVDAPPIDEGVVAQPELQDVEEVDALLADDSEDIQCSADIIAEEANDDSMPELAPITDERLVVPEQAQLPVDEFGVTDVIKAEGVESRAVDPVRRAKVPKPSFAQSLVQGKMPMAQPEPKVTADPQVTLTEKPAMDDADVKVPKMPIDVATVQFPAPKEINTITEVRADKRDVFHAQNNEIAFDKASPRVIDGQKPEVSMPSFNAPLVEPRYVRDVMPLNLDHAAPPLTDRAQVMQTAAPTIQAISGNPDTARHIAQQMVVAVTEQPGKATEIALNPEELGRVRLSMTVVDGAITMNVTAERQETNDLLRRHIETLAQEFRELGFSDITFAFGQGETPKQAGDFDSDPDVEAMEHTHETAMPQTTLLAVGGGLDIRI